ncbi:MAG TPA: hypothetical protein DDZ88_23390 [Verrucomicrobiales bacterium]|nr:hypothetical protein [Verrucomicrobiales bacterium]
MEIGEGLIDEQKTHRRAVKGGQAGDGHRLARRVGKPGFEIDRLAGHHGSRSPLFDGDFEARLIWSRLQVGVGDAANPQRAAAEAAWNVSTSGEHVRVAWTEVDVRTDVSVRECRLQFRKNALEAREAAFSALRQPGQAGLRDVVDQAEGGGRLGIDHGLALCAAA